MSELWVYLAVLSVSATATGLIILWEYRRSTLRSVMVGMAKVREVRRKPRGKPKPEFVHTTVKNFISEPTILLAAFGNETSALGCGVIVGPRMALTARHVIEAFLQHHAGERPTRIEGGIQMNLRAIHFVDEGSRAQTWHVRKMYFGPTLVGSDLAILLLDPLTEEQLSYKWQRPFIQLLPPKAGSKISAFGYHSMKITTTPAGRERINFNPYTTTGTVEEIHRAARDKSQLRFPCFRTNARFDPGMSGAPVFSEEGFLCGIVCSNMPPEADDGEHVSYVSVLWPMMGIHVDYARPGEEPKLCPLGQLAQAELLLPVDLDKVLPHLVMMGLTQALAQELMTRGHEVRISVPVSGNRGPLPKGC
jgi:hypothetical protein